MISTRCTRSATASQSSRTRRWSRSIRYRIYWLWIILGYKSILTGPAGVPRRQAMITRSRPDGDPIELYHGRRRDGGSARRRAAVHRLARRALEQGDQMLRYLFLGSGRRAQQGLQCHLLGRAGRAGLAHLTASEPARIRLGAD